MGSATLTHPTLAINGIVVRLDGAVDDGGVDGQGDAGRDCACDRFAHVIRRPGYAGNF